MRKLLLACVLISLIASAASPARGVGRPQTVLVIYSNERSLPANVQVNEKLRETLVVDTSLDLKYQTEFLDYPRYGDEANEAYDKLVSNFLRVKYAGQSIDAIVAGGPQAFRFLRRHQDDLFVNVPVVAIAVGRNAYEDQPLPSRFLCIPIVLEIRPTLELAVRLQPKASEIVVVTGTSNFDLDWEKRIRTALTEWQAHPPVRYLSGLPLNDILGNLSRLPHNSIVYSPGMQRDGSGQAYANRDVVRRMAEVSSAPLYSSYSTMIKSLSD